MYVLFLPVNFYIKILLLVIYSTMYSHHLLKMHHQKSKLSGLINLRTIICQKT